jgi:transcriptional regulator with XRE-family HTH domain
MNRSRYTLCYDSLRTWLKAKRNEKGLSLRALAEKLELTHTIIGKIEHGDRKIDFIEFIEFCRALEADPHEGIDLIMSEMKTQKVTSRK